MWEKTSKSSSWKQLQVIGLVQVKLCFQVNEFSRQHWVSDTVVHTITNEVTSDANYMPNTYQSRCDAQDADRSAGWLAHIEQIVKQRLIFVLGKQVELLDDKDNRLARFVASSEQVEEEAEIFGEGGEDAMRHLRVQTQLFRDFLECHAVVKLQETVKVNKHHIRCGWRLHVRDDGVHELEEEGNVSVWRAEGSFKKQRFLNWKRTEHH